MNAADAPPGAGIGMQAQAARPAGRWRRLWRLLWPLPWTDPRAVLYDPWHGRNPVFLHELYAMRFQVERRPGRRVARVMQWIGLVIAVPVIVYALGRLAYEIARAPEPLETIIVAAAIVHVAAVVVLHFHLPIIGAFAALSPAAASINRERDRGTWDLLRTTALDARRIVLGKALAAAEVFPLLVVALIVVAALRAASLAVVILLLPAPTPSSNYSWYSWMMLLLATVTASLAAPLAVVAGVACGVAASAWVRWTAAANGLAVALYSVLGVLLSGVVLVPLLVVWAILPGRPILTLDDVAVFAAVLPLAMALIDGLAAAGLLRLAIAGVRRRE